MQLTKHHGLGNDFLVALEEVNGPLDVDADRARALCDRRRGVGADGLIVGRRPRPDDGEGIAVVMELWNADGSRAEMSGNGIRCLGHAMAMARDEHEVHYLVATEGGPRHLVVHDDAEHRVATVSVSMGSVGAGPEVPASVAERLGERRHGTADLGNPHLVVLVDDLASVELTGEGSWFEQRFPAGVNVEYITVEPGTDTIELLVWERGAGATAACGTGATAAAHLAHRWGLVGAQVQVSMPGGTADVVLGGDEPLLIGPSQHVATLELADG
ncbi:diaminopimelate epimerase [Rhabdothermincola salaria]|uniref:diaminopimelate epimerase n=1 Tax=Rhabdothermincola salaria TaxID=2903142 RepID=UPI001E4C2A06|nr:diaminopimelate epimerase [Rhabdothermincola salaria]MCD9624884.1 diaminopimelate epimerase [Rhabdothermincola salaria]